MSDYNKEKLKQQIEELKNKEFCLIDFFYKPSLNTENIKLSWFETFLTNQKVRSFFTINMNDTAALIELILDITFSMFFGSGSYSTTSYPSYKKEGKKSLKRVFIEILFLILVISFWISLIVYPNWFYDSVMSVIKIFTK